MNNTANSNSTSAPTQPVPPPEVWIGLDWGDAQHAFALQDRAGHTQEGTLTQSAESLHGWLRELQKRYGARPVVLAIEASRGPVIHALVQYPWLTVYPINPVTSARYRKAFTPSGAADDLPDARLLLELVRDHAAKLRPLQPQDPQTLKLTGLVETRRDLVDRKKQVLNQLGGLIKSYYPQALKLVGNLNTPMAWAFLDRWPDLPSLKAAKPGVIKAFYYTHNLRRPELLKKRLEFIGQAEALTTEEARVSVAVLHLRALLDQARALHKHIALLEKEIKTGFAAHPEAGLFRNLPGAGQHLAPRLCVAFGTQRDLYPEPASLQKLAGVAPVREKSGHSLWTHWRWLAPKFQRQTFVEWAGQTVMYSAWAKHYYERTRAKGKDHHKILRALAFKWIRVLWKCWQTRVPYAEERYLKQLRHRKSPNALAA